MKRRGKKNETNETEIETFEAPNVSILFQLFQMFHLFQIVENLGGKRAQKSSFFSTGWCLPVVQIHLHSPLELFSLQLLSSALQATHSWEVLPLHEGNNAYLCTVCALAL